MSCNPKIMALFKSKGTLLKDRLNMQLLIKESV